MTGLRTLEIEGAFGSDDSDVYVAFAALALERADREFDDDQLWDLPQGHIDFYDDPDLRPAGYQEQEESKYPHEFQRNLVARSFWDEFLAYWKRYPDEVDAEWYWHAAVGNVCGIGNPLLMRELTPAQMIGIGKSMAGA